MYYDDKSTLNEEKKKASLVTPEKIEKCIKFILVCTGFPMIHEAETKQAVKDAFDLDEAFGNFLNNLSKQ